MRKYKFILTFALLFFTLEALYAQRVPLRTRRPQTRTRVNTPREVPRPPQRRTDTQRTSLESTPSNLNERSGPNRSRRIFSEDLRILGLQEAYSNSNIEPSLNHAQRNTQRTRLERSISILAEYKSTELNNRQAELIEKLGQAVLLSPTHDFIGLVIRTLTAGKITSTDKISSLITVLDQANSSTTATFKHTEAIDKALVTNGYSRDENGAWCI